MRILISFLLLLLLGAAGLAGGGLWVLYNYGSDLPDYWELSDYQPEVVTRIHSGSGQLLAEFAKEKRVFVPVHAMPDGLKQAFIAAEDQRFYTHPGFDLPGIFRAAITNVKNHQTGRRLVGASTITQQVAKNFFLTNERSIDRKIKEVILAFRMERAFDKDQILELYLNEIYLGKRSYGVAAAALNYFNKSLDELTLEEMAYLASLPKAPNNYQLDKHYDAAIARRDYVLTRMWEDSYITEQQMLTAKNASLIAVARKDLALVDAPAFVEEVRRELVGIYGEDKVYGGGLSVRTTLDPRLQDMARNALRDGIQNYDRRHGWRGPLARLTRFDGWPDQLAAMTKPRDIDDWRMAVVLRLYDDYAQIGFADKMTARLPISEMKWARAWQEEEKLGPPVTEVGDVVQPGDVILVEPVKNDDEITTHFALRQLPAVQGALLALDPHTGRVLAMVGGSGYKDSAFNRTTQAKRQPGSAIKPFVYLSALEKGFTPSTLVLDNPIAIDQGYGKPKWRPSNYSKQFYGPTPLRVGLEKSRNLMTVRLAQYVGMEAVADTVAHYGIDEQMPHVLSMSLGAGETTLIDMTAAYAMLANGGKQISPTMIDRIQDRRGTTLYRHDQRSCAFCHDIGWAGQDVPLPPDERAQIGDARHVYQVVSMLEGVVQRGTGRKLRALNRPLAGKTGTTNDFRDAWFIGFSPDLAVGVYIGFDDPRPLGDGETGSKAALPIVKQFLADALQDQPATPFRLPEGLALVRVNPKTGNVATTDDRRTIWEAFIPGTQPEQGMMVLGNDGFEQYATQGGIFGGSHSGGSGAGTANTGTGGIY